MTHQIIFSLELGLAKDLSLRMNYCFEDFSEYDERLTHVIEQRSKKYLELEFIDCLIHGKSNYKVALYLECLIYLLEEFKWIEGSHFCIKLSVHSLVFFHLEKCLNIN